MKTTFSLGRVRGIAIGLNWSVLGLLALLMWSLATGIFPSTNPGLGDNTHFAMAVVASLAFFGSILLHELGHAIQAQRDGMRIDGITLWLFGGVARFAGMFPSAGAEFRIAAAGPAVSALLGGAFLAATQIPGLPEPVDGVCAWLGFTNIALLVFNLIPALPLDGGRMLRAALWRRTGDLTRATVMAAGAGRVLAIGLIGLGIGLVAFQNATSGIWLALIGWFVLQAAGAEARYVQGSAPGGLRVADMLSPDPATTSPDTTLAGLAALPARPAYAVVDDGRVVGLLTAHRIAGTPPERWDTVRVADLMLGRFEAAAVSPGDGIAVALAAIEASGTDAALVLEGDRLVGLLSTSDVARALRARAGGA